MRRNEVLSLLERFPELVDGDDDLLHELFAEAGPELPDKEPARPIEPVSSVAVHERPAMQPRWPGEE